MNLIKWDPFSDLDELQKTFFGNDLLSTRMRSPTSDIYVNDGKELIVEAHLPGFNKEDIEVNVNDGVLEIRGERHEKDEDKKKKYVVRESSSSFYRRVSLPQVANDKKVEAEFENGTLKVTVPYAEPAKPKNIEIKSSGKKLKA